MFDIGFSELAVIGVVALIVIGPEKLPGVARTVGHLLGRLRRYVGDVKADISREMELADLKRMKDEVQQAAQSLEHSIHEHARSFEEGVRGLPAEIAQEGQPRHDEFGVAAMIEESTAPSSHATADAAPAVVIPPLPGSEPEPVSAPQVDENQLDMFAPPPHKP